MIKSEAIVGVPNMVFKTRVRDESIGGDNPYRWQDVSTDAKIVYYRSFL